MHRMVVIDFVDISEACGGSNTQVGEQQYFVDSIHLNKRGYCAAFSLNGLQSALGCGSGPAYDCASTTKVGCSESTSSGGFPTQPTGQSPSSSSSDSDSGADEPAPSPSLAPSGKDDPPASTSPSAPLENKSAPGFSFSSISWVAVVCVVISMF